MRPFRFRALLLAGAAPAVVALAGPATAQDQPPTPAVQTQPLNPRDAIPAPETEPGVILEPGEPSPADAVPPAVPAETPADADGVPIIAPAVAEAPPIPAEWSPVPTDGQDNSAYGLYLSGRLAGMRGDRATSADFLARTHALTPEQPRVADEAFRAALFAGDVDSVVLLTNDVGATPLLAEAGRLFTAVEALRRGDGRQAQAVMASSAVQPPYDRVAGYLSRVMSAAGGDWDAALAPVAAETAMPQVLVQRSQRALLLEARRRHDEAETEYRTLLELPGGQRLYGVDYAGFLERRGRRDQALAAYAAALNSATPDPRALVEAQRLQARGRAPAVPNLQSIAGEALEFGALEMTELSSHELAVIFLQLASALHPSDATTLRLAQSLGRAEQTALAEAAFGRVSRDNAIQYAAAQMGLADLLAENERQDEALAAVRRAAEAAPGQPAVARRLAAGLIDREQYDEALAVLEHPALQADPVSPEVRFLRGYTLSQLNRLDEAEAELWTALQAAPDNPTLLNQLGYMWVDSGRRVEQGAEMLARAHAADPSNGNIQDSLGWAQYRQGQFETAVTTLEEAVAKLPGNAEIVDHLGDAYWQVGRRREAEWQWRRVLTLEPEPERRAIVEAKLAGAPPEVTPAPSVAPVTVSASQP